MIDPVEGPLLLEMRGIRKAFGSSEVLHGVDFSLKAGEVHAVVGHNGAGKSTLMKVIAGVYPDASGSVAINGTAVQLKSPRDAVENKIAIIYQDFALVPELSVADNIALGREPCSLGGLLVSHRQLRAQSAREAAEFGIDLPMDTPVRQLGVAGKQLTEIARALAKRARILIMDEPTARLAPDEKEHLFGIMRRLAASGVGIIYISHFLEEIEQVADRVTVLRDGNVVATYKTGETSLHELTRLLTDSTTDLAELTARTAEDDDMREIAAGQKPVLELVDFSVRGRPPINLSVRRGEVIGIAGLVGSGRTSLARGVLGDVASQGEIRLDGKKLGRLTPRSAAQHGIVMVPEDRKTTGLVLTSSIRGNAEITALASYLSRFGFVRRRRRDAVVAEALKRFRILPPEPARLVSELSGGNAQKVLLARAAMAKPSVLILDQPTAGVDVGAKAETVRQIRRMVAEGMGVLLISDDLDELLELSNQIAVMTAGAISGLLSARSLDRATLLAAISKSASRQS
jgi:ABC-type sugar transport system ATPase subunit